jgi:hypothetical protein
MRGTRLNAKSLENFLTAALTVCFLNESMTQERLNRLITDSARKARKRARLLQPRNEALTNIDAASRVLGEWSRNPRYLDNNAQPIAIRARGEAPSIEALFKGTRGSRHFKEGFERLVELGLIRKKGKAKFSPSADHVVITKLNADLVAHVADTINKFISTVLWNTARNRGDGSRLIERATFVDNLPPAAVKEFRRYSRDQGAAFVSTINDWLEDRKLVSRSSRSKAKGNQTVGLHVFSFVGRGENP